jgi:hypothetical protein
LETNARRARACSNALGIEPYARAEDEEGALHGHGREPYQSGVVEGQYPESGVSDAAETTLNAEGAEVAP